MTNRSYRIVVPTRDSERWIRAFHRGYRRLGIDPIYLYDLRSCDRTFDILQELGVEVLAIRPRHDRVECMLEATRAIPCVDWVVRFDDDELPSAALIAWLDGQLGMVAEPSLAISRRHVLFHGGGLHFSRMESYYFHPQDPTFLDPQWRGFRPHDVRFTDAIHTAGFEVGAFHTAPQSAYFVHFDWLLRTVEQRKDKLRRYEAQKAGGGWKFAEYYLPEMHHLQSCRWTAIGTNEFDPLIADFAHFDA